MVWTQEPLNWRVSASIGATKLAFIHAGGIAAALSSGHGLATGEAPFDPPPISPAMKVALCDPRRNLRNCGGDAHWSGRVVVARGNSRSVNVCRLVNAALQKNILQGL